jgi:hypothetical protein
MENPKKYNNQIKADILPGIMTMPTIPIFIFLGLEVAVALTHLTLLREKTEKIS